MKISDLKKMKILYPLRELLYSLKPKGWFGRSAQIEALIPFGKAEKDMTKEERAAAITQFNQKYPECKEIQLHALWCSRIGEFILRCIAIAMDSNENTGDHIVHVFVPVVRGSVPQLESNSRLMRIMRRRFIIISPEDAAFWKAVFIGSKKLWKKRSYRYFDKYINKRTVSVIPPEVLDNLIVLNDEEVAEAGEKIWAMGLHQPFVCISSRDQAYLETLNPEQDWSFQTLRNSKIAACAKAAEYLKDQGIQTVRMGRYERERADFSSCIDYANDYYDELLDIVLSRSAKFFVSDNNGINILPYVSGVPVALKNMAPLSGIGWGRVPQSDKGLFICKKYFLKAENRYLSLREMLELEARGESNFTIHKIDFYLKNGIEVIENTEEEIYDLVKEMNERLDGTWEEAEEGLQLQEKFRKMRDDHFVRTGREYHACLHCDISVNFLKRNPFLLDS